MDNCYDRSILLNRSVKTIIFVGVFHPGAEIVGDVGGERREPASNRIEELPDNHQCRGERIQSDRANHFAR